MNLQDRLDAISRQPSPEVTPDMEAVMARVVEDLRRNGAKERVIKPGAIAPNFALQDMEGRVVALADLREQGPIVVSFYRGIWCSYCNEDLRALQETLPAISEAGASLVAISPQTPANSRKAARDLGLSFPLLWDDEGSVADAFGVRFRFPVDLQQIYAALGVNLEKINGKTRWTLPMPGRFVVERDGVISYAECDPDYTRRPDPQHVVSHLIRNTSGDKAPDVEHERG